MTCTLKLPLLFVDFFKNQEVLASVSLNLVSYFSLMQYLGHLLMYFNRFTLFWFPLKHERIWRRNWYIYALILGSLLNICYKFYEPATYTFGPDNVVGIALINQSLHELSYVLATFIYGITTFLAAVFNVLTFIKFKSSKHSTNTTEKRLFRKYHFRLSIFDLLMFFNFSGDLFNFYHPSFSIFLCFGKIQIYIERWHSRHFKRRASLCFWSLCMERQLFTTSDEVYTFSITLLLQILLGVSVQRQEGNT